MSSGRGIHSKHGRCFSFWNKVLACRETAELPYYDCNDEMALYLRCLHRVDEVEIALLDCYDARCFEENSREKKK